MHPYTYLIGWKSLNVYYYGVRYSKHCEPADLFVTYHTSSKTVKRFVQEHGTPDIIEIRKTFESKAAALNWEQKVLLRLGVPYHPNFLNKGRGGTPVAGLPGVKKFYHVYNPMLDPEVREAAKDKLSASRKRRGLGSRSAQYLKPNYGEYNPMRNPETVNAYKKRITGRKMRVNADGSRSWYYPEKERRAEAPLSNQLGKKVG